MVGSTVWLSWRTPALRRTLVDLAMAKERWNGRLILLEEVEHALQTESPVAALESTIITHGMPHPTNISTALSLESIIRSHSAVPATIALLSGRVHVGLTEAQLTQLADPTSGKGAVKVSRRDLAATLAMRRMGGTTVAGTMFVASSVGIKVFVTGGIGGVHRGAENSMDISADLIELGRTPMGVICAGAKSILDIPRTLEFLETQGVCVATYGDKPDFPAFYTPSSGQESPWTVKDATTAARLIYTSLTLPTPLSTLLAVPIPSEYAARGAEVQMAVEQAVLESVEQGINMRGKEVTPWLLKRVGELTRGTALELNVKLIENNAHVGAQVAGEVAKLEREQRDPHASSSTHFPSIIPLQSSSPHASSSSSEVKARQALPPPSVLVFGSAAIDITSASPLPLSPRSTTPGEIFVSPGGVGRNIAESAQNLLAQHSVQLVSLVGREVSSAGPTEPDPFGKLLTTEMERSGLRTDGLVMSTGRGSSTAACNMVLDKDGDLVAGVADMEIVESLNEALISEAITKHRPRMVVFDCNPVPEVITEILKTCTTLNIPSRASSPPSLAKKLTVELAFCDPTSIPKLPRLVPALLATLPRHITAPRSLIHISPNLLELDLLYTSLNSSSPESGDIAWEYVNSLNLLADWRMKVEAFTNPSERDWMREEGVVQKMVACLPYVGSLWVKASHRGLLHLAVVSELHEGSNSISHRLPAAHGGYLVLKHYPAIRIPEDEIISTTGAGDTLVGGLVAGVVRGSVEEEWVGKALERVRRTMRSRRAVG